MECPREQEVASAARVAGWRSACSVELKRHIDGCEMCGGVAALTEIMREEYDFTVKEAQLPLAGQVWWRAAVRARAEASKAAVRPLTWVHGVAAACAFGLVAAGISYLWPSLSEWVSGIAWRLDPAGTMFADFVAAAQARLPLVVAIIACLILTPVALYFALRDEEGGP